MLTITYGPVHSFLTGDKKRELKEACRFLDQEMSVFVDGYFFSPKYQLGTWDGKKHFFSPKTGKFLSGLLTRVFKLLRKEGFKVSIEGFPEPWQSLDDSPITLGGQVTLYPYQADAVKKSLMYHRGILHIATNGGKTEVCAGLLQVLGVPPSLFIVPRRELLYQTVERFQERLGVKVGVVGDNKWEPHPKGVTVAMYQTLARRLKSPKVKQWLNTLQAIIGDEIHFLSASDYQKVFLASSAEFRLGVSGTPSKQNRVERLTVKGITGPILAHVSNCELIEQKRSVRPSLFLVEPKLSPTEKLTMRDHSWDYAIQDCSVRNDLIINLARALISSGRQTLVMVSKVKHGKILNKLMPEAVLAYSNSGNRDEVIQRLKSGEVFCVICTAIFDTGLSVDHIEGMIMASGGKSDITLLQRIGRTLRLDKTKAKDVWIVDFMDTYNRYTKKHSTQRRKVYENENAFVITENVSDLPGEVQSMVDMRLVHTSGFRKQKAGKVE